MREVILHCFRWKLRDIIKEIQNIKDCGYTAIQISPVQPCKPGPEWWTDYQPTGFSIGNRIGDKEDLIELCRVSNALGIKVITDVVLRHTAGLDNGELLPHESVDANILAHPEYFTNAYNAQNHNDRREVTEMAWGVPMLDYYNHDLQNIYINFLQELKDCGVGGFRVDMGKHFALPEENCDFWTRVFSNFSDMYNYAECIDCERHILDKYTPYMNVLTNYGYSSDRSKSVIFIMSHDTEETWGFTKGKNDDIIKLEWDSLLEKNPKCGVLFYARAYSDIWKSESVKASNLRHNLPNSEHRVYEIFLEDA